jgi:glycosyltransferase involved in cell wall biosynthesis
MQLFAKLLRRPASVPLVSVVVASYNHAPFVQECLRSALSQGIDDLEIIVTDDGSTDATAQQVAALGDPRIHLHTFAQNRGACMAMNDAIRRSRGRYIAVLNSDDLFLPGKLRRQIDFLDLTPQVGAVFGWPSFIDEQGQPFHDPAHKDHAVFLQHNRSRHQWLRHFFDHGNALCHPTAVLRREVYQSVGLYDPRLAQVPDLDQWIRVCMRYDIHVLPEPLTAFRIRSGQQNASGARPEVVRRDAWERADVLRHYLRLTPPQLLQVFPEFAGHSASLAEQLACHALALDTPFHQRFALQAWFDALPAGGLLDRPDPGGEPQGSGDPAAWQRYIAATAAANPHRIGG